MNKACLLSKYLPGILKRFKMITQNLMQIKYWFIGLGLLTLNACEETMDINFLGSSARNLVVEGMITTDTTAHRVILSYTGDYFVNAEQQMVSGAVVTLSDGDTTFNLQMLEAGRYYTDSTVFGIPGKTYTLTVTLNDSIQYVASDVLHSCSAIDSLSQSPNYNLPLLGYGYDVLFYADEPEPVGDNYLFLLYINHVLYSDTIVEVSFETDEFFNGQYVADVALYRIREKDLPADSALVTLEMYAISDVYYQFLWSLMLETTWKGSPWDGPPASVVGNVSNKGKGFFRACDVKRKSVYFKPSPRVN
jgi:hypothetical protein